MKQAFARFHQVKNASEISSIIIKIIKLFSGLCVLFNLKLSRFISLRCLKQLSYYIKLISSCQQLFLKSFFRLFQAIFALFKQPRYNIINSTYCQLQFKLFLSYSDVWIKSSAKAVYLLYFFIFPKSSDFFKKFKKNSYSFEFIFIFQTVAVSDL